MGEFIWGILAPALSLGGEGKNLITFSKTLSLPELRNGCPVQWPLPFPLWATLSLTAGN